MSASSKFRPEIEGLRAIAVIAVIIYHINPFSLQGGFLGVDVFFVLSGFLITGIIMKDIRNESFSLRNFWARRIRRLYPALMTMVTVVAISGNFILISPERRELALQSIGAIFSFSNILLWTTTNGYWSSSSDNIALLHTWSLSLEEQFYIFLPLTLFFLSKLKSQITVSVLVIITLLSFSFSIYYTEIDRSGAFYLLPSRLWELSLGSLLAIFYQKPSSIFNVSDKLGNIATTLGLFLIAYSFYRLKNDSGFPKAIPLLPCTGTLLIIAFGQQQGLASKVLASKPFRYIGKISYSLYLWHWPVIVFAHYLSPNFNILEIVAATTILSIASYHLIEAPFRKGLKFTKPILALMPIAVGLALVPIIVQPQNKSIPTQISDLESIDSLPKLGVHDARDSLLQGNGAYHYGAAQQNSDYLLIGSSHARVLGSSFQKMADDLNSPGESLAVSGIGLTQLEATSRRPEAYEINKLRFDYIESHRFKVAIIAGMWSSEIKQDHFEENLQRALMLISKSSAHVIVLSQVPMHDMPAPYHGALRKYVVALARSGKPIAIKSDDTVVSANAKIKDIVDSLPIDNVDYIDIHSYLIENDDTVKTFADGSILYGDYHHLNDRGANLVFSKIISPYVKNLISQENLNTGLASKLDPPQP